MKNREAIETILKLQLEYWRPLFEPGEAVLDEALGKQIENIEAQLDEAVRTFGIFANWYELEEKLDTELFLDEMPGERPFKNMPSEHKALCLALGY